jgi:hypothetical protein
MSRSYPLPRTPRFSDVSDRAVDEAFLVIGHELECIDHTEDLDVMSPEDLKMLAGYRAQSTLKYTHRRLRELLGI